MSVAKMRELICDCRDPKCVHGQPMGERCVGAVVDYANTDRYIRLLGDRQGWSTEPGARNQRRDFCPACTTWRRERTAR